METETKAAKSKTGLVIGIVIAVVAVIVIGLVVILCINGGKETDGAEDAAGSGLETDNTEGDAKKWVGSDEYGYVEVPESWSAILGSEEGLQYGSSRTGASTGYYVSMLTRSADEIDAETWAEGIAAYFEQTGASDIETTTKKIGSGTAHVVTGYYAEYSRWLAAYTIDMGNGKTYYVSIEGPDKDNTAFKIPETFKLTK